MTDESSERLNSEIRGAIDTHVHTSPDVVSRIQTDGELARDAFDAGVRAVILKSHIESTASRARIVSDLGLIEAIGGIALNAPVGGLNPEAVRTALALGARVVWMPTISASNHLDYFRTGQVDDHIKAITPSRTTRGLTVLNERGSVLDEVRVILDQIAEAEAVLATGHLSVEEILAIVSEARMRGVSRILVTHPEAPQIDMPVDVQRELAEVGVRFERCYYSILAGTVSSASMVETIRQVGLKSTVLATDLGQSHNPRPVEGLCAFRTDLIEAGLTESEWGQIASSNASELLGLTKEVA